MVGLACWTPAAGFGPRDGLLGLNTGFLGGRRRFGRRLRRSRLLGGTRVRLRGFLLRLLGDHVGRHVDGTVTVVVGIGHPDARSEAQPRYEREQWRRDEYHQPAHRHRHEVPLTSIGHVRIGSY